MTTPHTFGRRLRAAGVSFEDRQDLLGHKSGRVTTHYSCAELAKPLEASNKVCEGESGIILTLLKRTNLKGRVKVPRATRSRMIKVPAGS